MFWVRRGCKREQRIFVLDLKLLGHDVPVVTARAHGACQLRRLFASGAAIAACLRNTHRDGAGTRSRDGCATLQDALRTFYEYRRRNQKRSCFLTEKTRFYWEFQ
jgi:hypothetical protein